MPLKIWDGVKHPKFGAISDNFQLWSRIFSERIDVSQIRKVLQEGTTAPSTLGYKTLVNFGPQRKTFQWLILTNPSGYPSGDYISAIRGCCALNFLNALEIDQDYLADPPNGDGVPRIKFNCKNLNFCLKFSVWAPITSMLVGLSSPNFYSGDVNHVMNFGRQTKKLLRAYWHTRSARML